MMLLAIDLGLRCGFAVYNSDGHLQSFRSTRFQSKSVLKRAAWGVLKDIENLTHLVVEGDRLLAEIWQKAAEKQSISFDRVAPEVWRDAILYDREKRNGKTAKKNALTYAMELIELDEAPAPVTPISDDVAEAILIGLWAVESYGWRTTE